MGSKDFEELKSEIRYCKLNKTCPDRDDRQFYFKNPISNKRVMFVCETPGTLNGKGDGSIEKDNWEPNTKGERFFIEARKAMGLTGAYITNLVKCGKAGKLNPNDPCIERCRTFLENEIALLSPSLIICVGKTPEKVLKHKWKLNIPIAYVPHYSYKVCGWKKADGNRATCDEEAKPLVLKEWLTIKLPN
jgi:uracil-DNA glycosylase family 4